MHKILLSALLASVAVPAFAADMPLKAPLPERPIYTDWTGFYLFGFGGYSWGKITPDSDATIALKPKGGVFGFGGGYLAQYGNWVGGLEVDYGFSNEKGTLSTCLRTDSETRACVLTEHDKSKIDALGSARLRAGYLILPNLLAYGTAGVGWGRSEIAIDVCGKTCATLASAKTNEFGWVAGGGVEFKLFEHLRLRGEYLHYDFGSTSHAFQTPIIGVNINAKTRDDVARGALIWSFN
jgi:outer membrane immunogenic protein